MNKFVRFKDFKLKAVTFSYDDGVAQDKRLIDIMKKNGIKGTFNVSAGLLAKENNDARGRLSEEEARELYLPSGMEVALHGYRHMSLSEIPMSLATDDMVRDRRAQESLFNRITRGMAYANGSYSDEVMTMLRGIGVSYARTVKSTESFDLPDDWLAWHPTCHHNNPRLMELAERFTEIKDRGYFWSRRLSVFYLWGHSYEFDTNENWNRIEEFCAFIGKRDDIWYATNGEICDYLRAADALVYSIDGNVIENPTSTDIYLNVYDKPVVVPACSTVRL